MKKCIPLLLLVVINLISPATVIAQVCTPTAVSKTNSTKIYIHYLPWYTAPQNPVSGQSTYGNGTTGTANKWGTHWWNEGSYNTTPDNLINVTNYLGSSVPVRNIASNYHPLIGPYDGQDTMVLEYHLLLMKLCGIDGIIIDWYGADGMWDHTPLLTNSNALINKAGNYGLKYSIMMEDGGYSQSQMNTNGAYAMSNYFNNSLYPGSTYITLSDMRGSGAANATSPLVGDFGPVNNGSINNQSAWDNGIFNGANPKPALVTFMDQSGSIGDAAFGEFAWPEYSSTYATGYYNVLNAYYTNGGEAPSKNVVLGVACPGFNDVYNNGGNYYNLWPRTTNGTTTLKATLGLCQTNQSVLDGIQLATWNDFGEGTIMEPTVEEGFQSLDTIQKFTGVSYTENDLKEVYRLFILRKQYIGNSSIQSALNQVACYFNQLQIAQAETLLDCIYSTGSNCSQPSITSSSTTSSPAGSSFSYQITASNGPITRYGASGLPIGLTINTSTGVISGTLYTVGSYTVIDSATNSNGTGYATLTLNVTVSSSEIPYGGTPWPIPGVIQSAYYDEGGEGVAYHDNDVTNDGGAFRLAEGVDLENCPDSGGGYNLAYTNSGEWIQYTINVLDAGIYTFNARTSSITSGNNFSATIDGDSIGTINIPNTGSWSTYQTTSITTPALTSGIHKLRITENTGGFNLNYVTFSIDTLYACPNGNGYFIVPTIASGNTYQWQLSTDNGNTYTNIGNSSIYSGVTADMLVLNNAPSSFYGYLYRCTITNGSTTTNQPGVLEFEDTWTGAIDNTWETAANWSCSDVPDNNTDVIINSGTPIINSTVNVRSIKLNGSGSQLTVNPGDHLNILH
jgi:carbohydrate binding protein with CBM6 domain/putative Ig domain-containing protein